MLKVNNKDTSGYFELNMKMPTGHVSAFDILLSELLKVLYLSTWTMVRLDTLVNLWW